MRAKITKKLVDSVMPGIKDQFVWDTDLKGFGLKVTRWGREKTTKDGKKVIGGGEKTYIAQYRKRGRPVPLRVRIGRHGALTPDQAREEAARILGAVALGGDPAGARAAEKAAPTVATFVARFLEQHVDTKTKPRTAAEYHRLAKIISQHIGQELLRDVTEADVARMHHALRKTLYEAVNLSESPTAV
jgi:hypothetical protein